MAIPKLIEVESSNAALTDHHSWDAVVVVSPTLNLTDLSPIHKPLRTAAGIDARIGKDVCLIPAPDVAGGRLIFAPTGPIHRDYDDVRRYGDAAKAGIRRAKDAGAKRPLVIVPRVPIDSGFERTMEVCLLGCLEGLWEPLQAREARGEDVLEPVTHLGFFSPADADAKSIINTVIALEEGRRLARDLTDADPERMTPRAFALHCQESFAHTDVQVEIVDDIDVLHRDYPLMMAVGRASLSTDRHRPCVLRLRYRGKGSIRESILLAGKGVTYDTGGSDLKVGGNMAGMSRDKGGAGAVAGLLRTVAALEPESLHVEAEIGLVRNSVGTDAYVADEILVSHAGTRVRVGNTDGEGRLVLADLLSHLRQVAEACESPRVLSVATLTGHASRAVGQYTVVVENGPARKLRLSSGLSALGDQWADPIEVSRLRREDYDFIEAKGHSYDVIQCNNGPSSATNRGHQFPAAFLLRASGLDKFGLDSKTPIPFVHVDLGGSVCEDDDWQHGRALAPSLVAMAARWVIDER